MNRTQKKTKKTTQLRTARIIYYCVLPLPLAMMPIFVKILEQLLAHVVQRGELHRAKVLRVNRHSEHVAVLVEQTNEKINKLKRIFKMRETHCSGIRKCNRCDQAFIQRK